MTLNEMISDRRALLSEVDAIEGELGTLEQRGADVWAVRERLQEMRRIIRAQLRALEGAATTDMMH